MRADGASRDEEVRAMAIRIGPGPVFVYESLIFARRKQVYAGRMVFVLAVLIGLWISWWNNLNGPGRPVGSRPGTLQALARAGESFFYALAGIQLAMVLLVAPAATAGALCQDRARGILAQMATTDLTDAEIVLGKLFSRLAPILGLLACALPVVSLAALLGGIDGRALVGLFAVSAAVAVLGCALALAISVEVVKTDEVVMAVLALVTCWLLSLPLWGGMARAYGLPPPPEWFYATNPFVLVYAPYSWPGHFGLLEVALFAAAALAVSAGLLAGTIARLRRFVLPAEVGRRRRRLHVPVPGLATLRAGLAALRAWRERLPGPSLDGNPVLWREWHRSRPSRMARILWGLYWSGAILATGIGIYDVLAYGIDNITGGFMIHTALVLQSVLGLMLLSVQAPSALGQERIRGSLDVLMAAPISTRAIVWGKWMGTYRVALGLAVLPGVAAALIAAISPDVPPRFGAALGRPVEPVGPADRVLAPVLVVAELLSWGAAFTSLGLLLATWTPRIGRALGISVAVFLLLSVGWLFLCGAVILPALRAWAYARYNSDGIALIWIDQGLIAFSPMAAPIATIQAMSIAYAGRWQFWAIMATWCLLAWAAAGVMYVAVLRSFDRRLGRMRETSQGDAVDVPPCLVPVGAGCQNEER
jgi:ABC-type transport system involved in multi-copper enzyme maturation permease subunit